MVWTHGHSHPAQPVAEIGPWLARIGARLRARFSAPLPARSTEPRAFSLPQDPLPRTPSPFTYEAEGVPVSGFTRIGPFTGLQLPAAPEVAPKVEGADILPFSALDAPACAPAVPAQGPRFHAAALDEIPLALVLSRRAGEGLACLDWLADHALLFRRIAGLHPTSPIWSAPRGALLLVDLDTLGGITELVDPLMRLRIRRPDLSVILLSEEVGAHDFGTDRLAIADVTLRLPCAFASFEFALAEAPINTALWQERLSETAA